jgi:hypothetical protein
MWTDPGNIRIAHRHMNVEIGAEAALFPEKEYINGIAVAVWGSQMVGLGRWVAKLVARLHATAALCVRIQTYLKNTIWAT